jgi:hypothetical protein
MPTRIYETHFTAFIHMDGFIDEAFPATVTTGEVAFKDIH